MQNFFTFFSIIFLLSFNIVYAQPSFPPNAPLFDSAVVARVDIYVDPDTLDWLYENVESDIEFHADFNFDNGTINESVEDVGFRLRGNTSRYSQKKSFKVSFNTFFPGRKFYGIEKMNLNGEHNDPSIARARFCWEWLGRFGVPAPRATHVRVYINGDYYGLYIMVEHVDEEFVESRFGNNDGNLYQCLYPADLAYLGANPDLYKFTSGDRRAYTEKINTEADDYSDLAHFIDVLNNTPTANLACELDKIFNLPDYLKIIAMDVVTGNWDGYIYNKNNFYLYHNTETGKFEYIPYDLDNTFGIDWFGRDWGTRNIYDWEQHSPETRPLYVRLMASPEIKAQYSFYMKQLLDMLGNTDSLFAEIDKMRNLISPYVVNDPYHSLDYGYSWADFMNSYNIALGDHVTYGLKPYLQTRLETAAEQLVLTGISPIIKYIDSSRPQPGEEFWVRAMADDEDPSPEIELAYRIDLGPVEYLEMVDDGNHHDRKAGDGIFGAVLPPFQLNQTLSWQVRATDNTGHSSLLPCLPVFITFNPSADALLFINELMADNDTTLADEFGEYDNWAEIYNGDDVPVWLGDKYLSDNLDNPNKWQLPNFTMQPGTFLVIWCDGQPEQGSFHTDYKLNDEGEELGIFDNETTGYFLLDSVSFGPQTIDISYGRQDDGLMPWVFFPTPTPGATNNPSSVPDDKETVSLAWIYPNPALSGKVNFREPFTGRITDLTGQTVWSGQDARFADISNLAGGIYIVSGTDGRQAKMVKR